MFWQGIGSDIENMLTGDWLPIECSLQHADSAES